MKRIWVFHVLLLIFQLSYGTNTMSKDMEKKRGVLLVAFGTSYTEARKAFENVENKVKAELPDTEVRWAYTSKIVRRILSKQGIHIDSPAEALAKMGNDGFTHVAVQSLHIIPGEEYENLKLTVEAFRKMPKGIEVTELGTPLLFLDEDIQNMASFIHQTFNKYTDKNSAFLLMGHGTHHSSNIYYPGFQFYLNQKSDRYWLSTVEGYPGIDQIIPQLKKQGIKKVTITPFMSIAGDHANNDMAGDEEDSWKKILEKEGFEVNIIMKGLADYPQVVNFWVEHLKAVFNKL